LNIRSDIRRLPKHHGSPFEVSEKFFASQNIMFKKKKSSKINVVKNKKEVMEKSTNDDEVSDSEDGNEGSSSRMLKRKREGGLEGDNLSPVKRLKPDGRGKKFRITNVDPIDSSSVDGVDSVLSNPETVKPQMDSVGQQNESFVIPAGHVWCASANVTLSFVGKENGSLKIQAVVSHQDPKTKEWSTLGRSVGMPDRWAGCLKGIVVNDNDERLIGPGGKYSVDVVDEIVGELLDEMIESVNNQVVIQPAGLHLQKENILRDVEELEQSEEEDADRESIEGDEENGVEEEIWDEQTLKTFSQEAKKVEKALEMFLGPKKDYDFFDTTVERKEKTQTERKIKKIPEVWSSPVAPPPITDAKQKSKDFERTVAARQREQLLIYKIVQTILLLGTVGEKEKMVEMGSKAIRLLSHLATGENYLRIRAREGLEIERNMRKVVGEPLVRKGQLERLKIRNEQTTQIKKESSSFFRGGRRTRFQGFGGFQRYGRTPRNFGFRTAAFGRPGGNAWQQQMSPPEQAVTAPRTQNSNFSNSWQGTRTFTKNDGTRNSFRTQSAKPK
jgi:hypothetical protein